MTCIATVVTKSRIYMAGDSYIYSSGSLIESKSNNYPKIFSVGDFLFGVSGTLRDANVLKNSLELDDFNKGNYYDVEDYISNNVIDKIRELLKDKGNERIYNEKQEFCNSEIICIYKDCIFNIGIDFSVFRPKDNFYAVGSGFKYALGSLESTKGIYDDSFRVKEAVKIAGKYDPFVGGKIKTFEFSIR